MPIPSPADLRNKSKKHSEVREMLAQMAENVESKQNSTEKANTAKSEAITAAATDATTKANAAQAAAQADATTKANAAEANAISYVDTNLRDYLNQVTQDFGYTNITTVGEPDFIKKLYLDGDWLEGEVFVDLDFLTAATNAYELGIVNSSATRLAYLSVVESDRTGVKTYDLLPLGSTRKYTGKIQIDWGKRPSGVIAISGGVSKNRYVKNAAKIDFSVSLDDIHELDQDSRLRALEKKTTPLALSYKRYLSPSISSENFNISGGWGFSNGFAVTSTPSATDKIYTKQKYISNKIQHKWTVSLRNDSIVKFGGFLGSTYIESTFVVDCVGKKLIINKKGDNASNPATPRASVAIPFNIVDNRDYFITIFRNNRKNSIKLTDAVTGESVTVEDDWSLAAYNSGSGNVRSLLYVTLASGTSLTVKKYENFLPSDVDVVFGGDSNTESSIDYNGVYQTNWADNLLTEVFGEYGAKFAEYGTVFTSWWTSIGEVIAMRPKFFIVNIGTNSATTQQQYQQIADICATNGIELILCHNPRTDGSKLHVPQNNLNMDAVIGVQIVKFGIATSTNYDLEQAYNSALFTDGVHLNIAGYRVLSNRVLADVPTLKSF